MPTKRAIYAVEFKALNDKTGQVEAVVSIFGNVDLQGDRVMPGAFAKSIDTWNASGDPIPVVFSHEWGDVWSHIGVVDSITEIPKGLRALYTLDIADNPVAAQVYRLMKRRSLKEHSFAYDVVSEHRAKDGANELTELQIIEIGPTLKGANPDTELIAVKSFLEAEAAKQAVTSGSLSGRKIYLDADLPGAFEETRDAIAAAALVLLNPSADPTIDVYVAATFPTYALVEVCQEDTADNATYQIPWTASTDPATAGEVTLGTPAEVDVQVTVTPKSAKAGRRLSQATQAEMSAIRDDANSLVTRIDALLGVAEDATATSSGTSDGAKTAATDPDESETEPATTTTESPTAKSADASVIELRTRIAEMRATTGITA